MTLSLVRSAALAATLLVSSVAAAKGASLLEAGRGKPAAGPTAAEAKAFVEQTNADLKRLWTRQATADWIKSTYITDDSEKVAAWANDAVLEYLSVAIPAAAKFDGVKDLDPETARGLKLIKLATTLPAPKDPKKREELTRIAAKLEGMYGKGKGRVGKKELDLEQLSELMAKSRKPDELLEAWKSWHAVGDGMKDDYVALVGLANEGAKEIGFADVGELWRSGYDMTPAEFEAESERLWTQVKPLYDELHCYTRARLNAKYGDKVVPKTGPIPAHLLGNMWAQDWENVYDLLEPWKGQPGLDVTKELVKQKWDAPKMVRLGENFFVSLGFPSLPKTFWERSLLTRPKDREVVCHASAWDLSFEGDLRIKMCIKPTEEELVVIHHELGHNYYYSQYLDKPVLFQSGAHDGFHEAIGDAIALSITPGYWKKVGLLKETPKDDKGTVNVMMKHALGKIAFLPFGKVVDQWRWDVYAGKIQPKDYAKSWWTMRQKYQGIAPVLEGAPEAFPAGAKYHVPGNVPYTRYFLAHVLQYQFHRAMCEAAGHKGPLHTCSIYGNAEAGKRLREMLALGASKPWPDALEKLTGQRQMDATAIIDYYAPLMAYLKKENAGKQCGW